MKSARPARLLRTRITELLGIEHPILCGGLMWLSDASYVSASARAGCIGFLTSRSFPEPDAFRNEIRRCRDQSEGNPFGVNFSVSKRPDLNRDLSERIDIALAEGVRIFETAGHSPAPILDPVHAAGGLVIHKSASIRHAQKAESLGADAVTIVGHEEGGHPGMNELSTFLMGTLAAQRIRVPVVMGGGIGSGQQIVALLGLGIDAVVMGSRFLVCDEINAHADYKQRLLDAGEHDTVALMRSMGATWRVLRNQTAEQVCALEAAGAHTPAEFGEQILGRYGREHAYLRGDWQRGMLSVGPAIAMAHQRQAFADILAELIAQAHEALNRLNHLRYRGGEQ